MDGPVFVVAENVIGTRCEREMETYKTLGKIKYSYEKKKKKKKTEKKSALPNTYFRTIYVNSNNTALRWGGSQKTKVCVATKESTYRKNSDV